MQGKLIVLDGLDGSGKSTQHALLLTSLTNKKIKARGISFPDYAEASSALVRLYLSGAFGDKPGDVNAYAASSFYAVDRYASFHQFWKKDYENGHVIVAARYTSSNLFHQMPKLPQEEWDAFLAWTEDYEYQKLALPKPDTVIYLDVDPSVSKKLISERYQGDEAKRDVHERDFPYLHACRRAALYAADKLGYTVIKCDVGDKMRSIEEIEAQILQKVLEALA